MSADQDPIHEYFKPGKKLNYVKTAVIIY